VPEPNHQKSQIIEYTPIITVKCLKFAKILRFCDFHFFAMRYSQMISRKLLTNLKLFVEEKYLRSRRAPRASTKSSKVQNHRIYTSNCDQNTVNPLKIDDLVILMFVVIRNSLIISKSDSTQTPAVWKSFDVHAQMERNGSKSPNF